MIETLRNAWRIQDLRKKIIFTVFVILLFRIGSAIPTPFLDKSVLEAMIGAAGSGTIISYIDVLTGGALSKATLFALSIVPYINASIILQLLSIGIPALERIFKEGEEGRKKMATATRYTTLVIALITAFGYYLTLRSYNAVLPDSFFTAAVIIATFAAGSMLMMWLGEQINEKGVGNGISILLFAGIVSRGPAVAGTLWTGLTGGTISIFAFAAIIVIAFLVIALVVMMNDSERRIPVQYAKRVVGRKMYGGQSTHIPVKVTMTGVMPIIFASSITSLPSTIALFFPTPAEGTFWYALLNATKYTSVWYAIAYFLLIIFFNYFYVAVQYNPIEMANNIKKHGGFIPGFRPGKPTSDFIQRVLSKITLIGALFLGFVAILPIIFSSATNLNLALGGTTILIVVGVALDTVKTLESQMIMRHYKGFLE